MVLAITPGDPAGIGPEVAIRALKRWDNGDITPVLYGPVDVWESSFEHFGYRPPFEMVSVPLPAGRPPTLPGPSAWGGAVAMQSIERAVEDAFTGDVHGLVTAPVGKKSMVLAGWNYPGQTDFLAAVMKSPNAVMMLAHENHRAVLLTRHVPLRSVSSLLTVDGIVSVATLVNDELADLLGNSPRLVVCGLNPHAGDDGIIGTEDRDIISPAVAIAQEQGINIRGPVAAEEAFLVWGKEADVVLAMYHDQGAIPVKMLGLGKAVNVTLGLPIVRTSPGHGTAYSLAGKDAADEESFLEALQSAVHFLDIRKR